MIKNIIIATLTIFSLISLYFAHIKRTKAEEMAELARSHQQRMEQLVIEAEHARVRAEEALKEAAFQREQTVQQVALLEAKLQKRSSGK